MSAKTASLITGATSGIGFELAKLFAGDSRNLVLVARSASDLEEAAEEFRKLGAPSVWTIPLDLSRPGAPAEVFDQTTTADIDIDILVNDAGVGQHGNFADVDAERDMEVIGLNIIAAVHLTKLYLKGMLARRSGKILQLASIASYQPTPFLAVYSATKAFILSLTDSLINELKNTGVTMTALIPGATDTDFFNKADAEHTLASHGRLAHPADVARAGYNGLMKGEHHVVPGAGPRLEVAMRR